MAGIDTESPGEIAAPGNLEESSRSRDKPQAQTPQKHPELYQHDLNPNAMPTGRSAKAWETDPVFNSDTMQFVL
jgi:hypothetical protein